MVKKRETNRNHATSLPFFRAILTMAVQAVDGGLFYLSFFFAGQTLCARV